MGKISPLAPKAGFPELNSIDGVRFSSACAGVKYKKTYYEDRELKPKEDLLFTITLIPLTTYEHNFDR